jgi:pimeloyl-ACP methyl ester carboxylesterase
MTSPDPDALSAPTAVVPPRSHSVSANGLEHHVLEWGSPTASVTAVLVHGYMDAAASWDRVAPRLAEAGLRVIAPDMRGYGDGARLPPGAYYYFPDYVFDLADLVEALVPREAPLILVGHSMGGTIATFYAGAFPKRATRVVIAEGAGPPSSSHAEVPDRMRLWIDQVRSARSRGERSMESRDEALRRLAANHPRVAVLESRVDALVRELPGGRVAWKADPLHATRSPVPFFAETYKEFARRIACPVLFISGGPAGWHPPDEEERLACFPDLRRIELEDAGHMMHWTHPEEFGAAILSFAPSPA